MLNKIIAIANQKGGVGKSTVTMTLAGALSTLGYKVLVVNADKQATAVKWASHAPDDAPFPASCVNLFDAGKQLPREVQKLYSDYDFTLMDCPPNLESVIPAGAIMISDLVLMVMRPTMTDFDSLSDFLPVVHSAQAMRETIQARVLINQYRKSAMASLTLQTLETHGIPRMETIIGDRTVYTEGDPMGSHVLSMKGVPAAAKREAKELRDEVLSLLGVEQ
jgi:chromosome partitioning protein